MAVYSDQKLFKYSHWSYTLFWTFPVFLLNNLNEFTWLIVWVAVLESRLFQLWTNLVNLSVFCVFLFFLFFTLIIFIILIYFDLILLAAKVKERYSIGTYLFPLGWLWYNKPGTAWKVWIALYCLCKTKLPGMDICMDANVLLDKRNVFDVVLSLIIVVPPFYLILLLWPTLYLQTVIIGQFRQILVNELICHEQPVFTSWKYISISCLEEIYI